MVRHHPVISRLFLLEAQGNACNFQTTILRFFQTAAPAVCQRAENPNRHWNDRFREVQNTTAF